ncbi:prepilin peptidase [Caldithrix abyssi]
MKTIDILVILFGLATGSFLNVCAARLPLKRSVLWGRSQCPVCGHQISWYDNIPLLSFVLLKGKCRYCKAKISLQYPLIEAFSALVTYALYLKFGLSITAVFYGIFIYFLIVIGLIDFKTKLILNRLLIPLFTAGVLINFFGEIIPFKDALSGAFLGGGIMWMAAILGAKIFKKEAMGMGDVKLAFVAGFFLGWQHILLALYLGFVIALLFILAIWLFKKKEAPSLIPMGPFLALGFIVYLFYGKLLIQWYLSWLS